jgi:hypothetical protein
MERVCVKWAWGVGLPGWRAGGSVCGPVGGRGAWWSTRAAARRGKIHIVRSSKVGRVLQLLSRTPHEMAAAALCDYLDLPTATYPESS